MYIYIFIFAQTFSPVPREAGLGLARPVWNRFALASQKFKSSMGRHLDVSRIAGKTTMTNKSHHNNDCALMAPHARRPQGTLNSV